MKTIIMMGLLCSMPSMTTNYQIGSGPWCVADNQGNLQCLYWSYSLCWDAVRAPWSAWVTCVSNPNP
jgi:hypothetical protein